MALTSSDTINKNIETLVDQDTTFDEINLANILDPTDPSLIKYNLGHVNLKELFQIGSLSTSDPTISKTFVAHEVKDVVTPIEPVSADSTQSQQQSNSQSSTQSSTGTQTTPTESKSNFSSATKSSNAAKNNLSNLDKTTSTATKNASNPLANANQLQNTVLNSPSIANSNNHVLQDALKASLNLGVATDINATFNISASISTTPTPSSPLKLLNGTKDLLGSEKLKLQSLPSKGVGNLLNISIYDIKDLAKKTGQNLNLRQKASNTVQNIHKSLTGVGKVCLLKGCMPDLDLQLPDFDVLSIPKPSIPWPPKVSFPKFHFPKFNTPKSTFNFDLNCDKSLCQTVKDKIGTIGKLSPDAIKKTQKKCTLFCPDINTDSIKNHDLNNFLNKIKCLESIIKSVITTNDTTPLESAVNQGGVCGSLLMNLTSKTLDGITDSAKSLGSLKPLKWIGETFGTHRIRNYAKKLITTHAKQKSSTYTEEMFNQDKADMGVDDNTKYKVFAIGHTDTTTYANKPSNAVIYNGEDAKLCYKFFNRKFLEICVGKKEAELLGTAKI